MKKLFSALTAAVMLISIAAPCTMADDTYIYLQTAADVKELADNCVIDSYSTDKVVVLSGDIDVSTVEFTGIPYFNGKFDGGGYTISGVILDISNPERGFIGTIGENGVVQKLNVSAKITAEATTKSNGANEDSKNKLLKIIDTFQDNEKTAVNRFFNDDSVYSIGGLTGINKGVIKDCTFSGSVKASENVGGIAGLNEGRIETSSNNAVITGDTNTGGIAGKNKGIIKWSQNYAEINNNPEEEMYATGGICGASDGVIEGCTNNSSVGYKNAGTATGGICGIQSGNITDCFNLGNVYGKSRVGGIAGNFDPYTNITYNEDEWSERLENEKDKIRNDLDDIDGRIDSRRNSIKDDLDDFDNRIKDSLGINDFNDNIKDAVDGINDVTDSLSGLNDVISDKIKNGGSLSSIADSIGDAVSVLDRAEGDLSANNAELKDLITETRNTAKTMSDVANVIADNMSGNSEHIMSLVDSINDNVNDEERRANINKSIDALDDAIESTGKAMDNISKLNLDNMKVNVSGFGVDILDSTDNQLSKILKKVNENFDGIFGPILTINGAFSDIYDSLAERKAKLEELKSYLEGIAGELPTIKPLSSYLPIATQAATESTETEKVGFLDSLFITAHAEENDKTTLEKLLDMDIKDLDIPLKRTVCDEEYEMALIKYCVNSAEVSGLSDIGGISGGVGFETGITSDKKISTDGEDFSLNPSTAIKAVISACINEGDVTAKNNTAGGITGFSDIGKIKDSINIGDIEVTDGSYAGGISAYDLTEIMRCINEGDVTAESDIGGIAGYAKDISQTYALTRTSSSGERIGAIAGTANGNLEHNYFLKEELGGVNGVNYNDKAQPIEKDVLARDGDIAEELSGLEDRYWTGTSGDLYMPQLRAFTENVSSSRCDTLKAKSADAAHFKFTAEFFVDDKSVQSIILDYGEVIPADKIPEMPKKNGKYGVWDNNVKAPIIRNTDFTAVYDKSTSTLSYGGEPPQLLVEGDFSPQAALSVDEFNPAAIVNDNKYKPIFGYEISITEGDNQYDGELKVHVKVPKDSKNLKIGLITDNSVVITDSEIDGSYILFNPDGASRFMVLSERPSPLPYIIIICILLIIAALLFKFRQRIKERRLLNKLKTIRNNINNRLLPETTDNEEVIVTEYESDTEAEETEETEKIYKE